MKSTYGIAIPSQLNKKCVENVTSAKKIPVGGDCSRRLKHDLVLLLVRIFAGDPARPLMLRYSLRVQPASLDGFSLSVQLFFHFQQPSL